MNITAVFLGGGLGSICRYLLSSYNTQNELPVGTIGANVVACLILGFLSAKAASGQPHHAHHALWMLLFSTGFCGGFSTFSTYMLESILLSKNGLLSLAILNIFLSIALGLIAIVAGMKLYSLLKL